MDEVESTSEDTENENVRVPKPTLARVHSAKNTSFACSTPPPQVSMESSNSIEEEFVVTGINNSLNEDVNISLDDVSSDSGGHSRDVSISVDENEKSSDDEPETCSV